MSMSMNAGKFDMHKDLVAAHSGMPVGSRFPVFDFLFSFALTD